MRRLIRILLIGLCIGFLTFLLSRSWKAEKVTSEPKSNPEETISDSGVFLQEHVWPKVGDSAGPDMDEETAMAFLFPGYDPNEKLAQWRPAEGSDDYRYFNDAFERIDMQSDVVFSSPYSEAECPHFIMIFQTAPYFESCHACQVVLGGVIFVQQGGQWRLKCLNPKITRAGSWGHASENMALATIGPDLHGVEVFESYMGQGRIIESFLLMGPMGDRLEELLFIPGTGESYSGDCDKYTGDMEDPASSECYAYSSVIRYVPGANNTYFDVKVITSGKDVQRENRIGPFERTTIYGCNGCCYIEGPAVDFSPDKPYYIQVAAFGNYQSAKDTALRLHDENFASSCEFHKPDSGDSIFRVRIHNYETRYKAESDLQKLKRLGYDGIILNRR